jgi:amidase
VLYLKNLAARLPQLHPNCWVLKTSEHCLNRQSLKRARVLHTQEIAMSENSRLNHGRIGVTHEGKGTDRRDFLKLTAIAVTSASINAAKEAAAAVTASFQNGIEEKSIAELQAAMTSGQTTALRIVNQYLERIEELDRSGPRINSVIELNPDARDIARELDSERAQRGARGPLHGIPILLKDNIDTADQMQTTAGSLALEGSPAPQDATVAAKLRSAGAIILGKANLSEWANFRSFHSSSGWSGRGGQTRNPNIPSRNPCGSSSGSAAAVAASFAAAALGTETDGSIVCPSSANGVVGIKPTLGLTSRAGVVPISHSQDTVGPHGRTVADAAAVLGALTGVDPRDPATSNSEGKFHRDYTQFLDPNGLQGARIGVVRNDFFFGYSEETDRIAEAAIAAMGSAGATMIDVDIPSMDQIASDPAELIVLVYEFKRDLNAYLATRTGVPIGTLADAIAFNEANADREMPFFLQELFVLSEEDPFAADYQAARKRSRQLSRQQGIDAILRSENLDALVAPTGSPAWPTDLVNGDHFLGASSGPAAMAGYPLINVTAGYAFGLPVGISFMGTAYSEPTLIRIAYAYEQATNARRPPQFGSFNESELKPSKTSPRRHRKYDVTDFVRTLRKRVPASPMMRLRGLL